jgi:2-dehydropantoate 2-reductase
MRICVVGAGALGGSFAARLATLAGEEVALVDAWPEHVAAIAHDGLVAEGEPAVPGPVRLQAWLPETALIGRFDLAFVAADANNTKGAAEVAARVLEPDGFALTVQNGIGNIETLAEVLGPGRVVGGSTMCSFRVEGPGRVRQTHAGPTTIGELDGRRSERVEALAEMLRRAGYEVVVTETIMATIWTKLMVNLSINPICAITGLRTGEFARVEATDRFQDRLLDEAFAVVRAKGLDLDEAAIRSKIKTQCWYKYNEPSMLQHMKAGRRTEIDAINGALVREAEALGVPVPFNAALAMLIKGRERHEQQRVSGVVPDWTALEREAEQAPRGSAG